MYYVLSRTHFEVIGPPDILLFPTQSGRWLKLGGGLGRGALTGDGEKRRPFLAAPASFISKYRKTAIREKAGIHFRGEFRLPAFTMFYPSIMLEAISPSDILRPNPQSRLKKSARLIN